ncbi:MAG: M48 family metalloprotease [Thaumarchaeota archaeon]|nr:M48 family metalloprotease [Nitrososphaerota archaeon]
MGKNGSGIIAGPFTLRSKDRAFRRLFAEATKRPPAGTPKITTVRSALLSGRLTKTMVGLTKYSRVRYLFFSRPRQSITFFLPLLSALSEPAVMAVIAHELAHAWLNEHVKPEESSQREHEADDLAREWGFGPELDALDKEAETVNAD